MSEARTKLDFLYQNVLGDVKEILDQMDALKEDLPNSLDGAIALIQTQNHHISSAAEKLNQSVNDITKRIDAYVSSAALHAGDAARVEVRQGVAEILNTLIYESLLPIINQANSSSKDSLEKLIGVSNDIEDKITTDAEKAIGALETAINTLKETVEEEGKKIEENKWNHFKYTAIAAFLGAGASITVSTILYIFKFGH